MRTILVASTILCSALVIGCNNDSSSKSAPSAKPTTTSASTSHASHQHAHAPEGVKPGSYEDWCGEHQVPESECTRCNSALEAAFKATGDWCKEHDLPESQCKKCNPDLKIERPPREGS